MPLAERKDKFMNQAEIGKFICSCRKEQSLTQIQLAEKLGITNRAVSKWETGRSLPDPSIMQSLCELLCINVQELLCAKKLGGEERQKQSEKTALMMLFANAELKRLRMCSAVLIFAGLTVGISLTSVMAQTVVEKAITLLLGGITWGYGLWLKVKVEKALKRMNSSEATPTQEL